MPNEVKDLTDSKQRVMQNVVNDIENTSKSPKRPKRKWRYIVIVAVVTMSAMLFVLNEIVIENEQHSATEFALDLTQPTLSEKEGLLYLHGVTLGDSQAEVVELLGENYAVEDYEDGSVADFILDYGGNARFYFYKDKLDSIIFMKVDANYFDTLFKEYAGVKFISGDHRFIYSKETSHIIKAEYDPDGNLHVSLSHAGPDLAENKEFLELEQSMLQDSPEYVAKNEGELSAQDSETAYEMCVSALTDYYKAVWNGSDIELDTFINNKYLKQYMQKKIQSQYELYGNFNDKVQSIEIGAWEVEYIADVGGGYLYLHLPVEINKTVGSYGEGTEFLVRNANGKLVIVDWYTGAKDSYDFMVRGEDLTIENPNIWNDSEWVNKLNNKQIEFSGSTR